MAGSANRRLLYLLAAAVGFAVLAITVDLSLERLAEARGRVTRNEARVSILQQALAPEPDLIRERDGLKEEVARRLTRYYAMDSLTPYTFGTLVKKRLQSAGMTVARYQIMDLKGRSFLEFSLSGSARGFLQFLNDVSLQDKYWVIPSLTVNARQGSDIVDVVFRIGYEVNDTKGH
jgi:hypothetical protein